MSTTYFYNGHSYQITSAAMTWTNAEAEAVSMGGHLVTINDALENSWLAGTFTGYSNDIWIGYSDATKEGTWVWTDGSDSTYANWDYYNNQPDNHLGQEDYGEISISTGRWNDLPNNAWGYLIFGIIEIPNIPNSINGDAGDNNLVGTDDPDLIFGYAGNDTLDGGLGADTMVGGEDRDIYYVSQPGDVVIEDNADHLVGGLDKVFSALDTYTLPSNVEGGAVIGNIAGNLNGNALDNTLTGNSSSNILHSGTGNDFIRGHGKSDLLYGNAGDDTLIGGRGHDTLVGGRGEDTFLFTAPDQGTDVIRDFTPGVDKIAIDGKGFGITELTVLTSDTEVPTPTKASPYILYNSGTGELWYDADGTGSQTAILLAKLHPVEGDIVLTDVAPTTRALPNAGITAPSAAELSAYDGGIGGLYYDHDGAVEPAPGQAALPGTGEAYLSAFAADVLLIA